MNQYEFVLAIIMIVSVVSIIKMRVRHRLGIAEPRSRRDRESYGLMEQQQQGGETARLRDEVKMLKDRIQTLERIAVDKENSLAREIDSLRDR